jgi:hypothetical protein
MPRIAMQTAMRAASVELLTDYASEIVDYEPRVRLQIYPGRPRSIHPPTAFIDGIRETITYTALHQRVPRADVIVIHGLFDSKDATENKDTFVDGFIDWVLDRYHAAGANTLLAVVATEDIPDYVPEWLPPAEQRTYYATRIELEGLALSG